MLLTKHDNMTIRVILSCLVKHVAFITSLSKRAICFVFSCLILYVIVFVLLKLLVGCDL